MKRTVSHTILYTILALSLYFQTGCIQLLGALGTGASMTASLLTLGVETKTISQDFGHIKRAVLVALSRMGIVVDKVTDLDDGEEILAKAGKLKINIKLHQITRNVTRITVTAGEGLALRDEATAKEIVQQTTIVAAKLIS